MKTFENINTLISNNFETGKLNNSDLIQIIELCGMYLNLKTIPEYAMQNKMSYNGVKKFRNIVKIFGCKFVVDND